MSRLGRGPCLSQSQRRGAVNFMSISAILTKALVMAFEGMRDRMDNLCKIRVRSL